MANITIAAPNTSTTPVTISVPTSITFLSNYLNTNRGLAVSIPYTGTGINLTAMGKYNTGSTNSVWRLRNGTSSVVSGTLSSYGGSFINKYDLPANSDTFVVSSAFATHKLTYPGGSKVKAQSSSVFDYYYDISSANLNNGGYTLVGGGGDDILIGANTADILIGKAGNDSLICGCEKDIFVLTAGSGSDTINDFEDGIDLIGLSGGLSFNNLTFSGNQISYGSEVLATLTLITTTDLTAADFTAI